MLRILCWNTRHRNELWQDVAAADADVALIQEACAPPPALLARLDVDADSWRTEGSASRRWRTAVVGVRAGLTIDRIPARPLADAGPAELGVSRLGTLAAARVADPLTGEWITLVSMYAPWESAHSAAGGSWIFADASAHRLASDLSALVGRVRGHRIVAAGDLNCLYGYGEHGSAYWAARYRTVFDRFAAIGLPFVGPQAPDGRQASPWPEELPPASLNVPTYYTSRQTPASATRQLDFVFASLDLVPRLSVRALNDPGEWGRSDHCRIEIVLRDA
jgi:endonuclease/exonuclease/phosphatase family metal-dependent hydrolase